MKIRYLAVALCSVFLVSIGQGAAAQTPGFSKVFTPDTIGPDGVSTLIFTIDNTGGGPITDLAFVDNLPIGPNPMRVADSSASTTCADATLTAAFGSDTITFSGGKLGTSEICTVTVNVEMGDVAATLTNTSGDLTSSAGNSGPASDDLTVSAGVPGFTKSFSPATVPLGGTSTLTFTIDNSLNTGDVGNLDFTDSLPLGLVVASPPNTSTDCISGGFPDTTLTAVAGSSTIALDANGTVTFAGFEVLSAGATCTVTVDVKATSVGTFTNATTLLADFVDAGMATKDLTVTGSASLLLTKDFPNDPVVKGATTELEFTIRNSSRTTTATNIQFDDVVSAMFTDATTTGTPPTDPCGTGSSVSLGDTVSLTGGTLAPEATCTFAVDFLIGSGAVAGNTYTNTTEAIEGDFAGEAVIGNEASADVTVIGAAPLGFTKAFVPGAVPAGDDVVVRYTITNPNTGAALGAMDITFIDELADSSGFSSGADTGFLPFPVAVSLPASPCGGSIATIFPNTDRQAIQLTGGTLLPTETSCSFDVTVTIPSSLPGGTYSDATGDMTATIDGETLSSGNASADLTVSGGLNLSFTKTFAGAVAPGGTVDLIFEIENLPESVDAESIEFTDNLGAMLAGATGGAPTTNDCGGSLSGVGSGVIGYTGGTLTAGAPPCQVIVPVTVPAAATSGTYPNATEAETVEAVGSGTDSPLGTAEADLVVAGLVFTKDFLSDPVIAGDTTTLRFSIENQSTTDASSLIFTDNLANMLPGTPDIAATGAPSLNTCGGTFTGTTFLTHSGGSVLAGQTCTIEVEVLVPAGAGDGTYSNLTSSLTATMGGAIVMPPAQADLTVQTGQISLTKSFLSTTAQPGGTATMRLSLENLNPAAAASSIAFTDDLNSMGFAATPIGLPLPGCGGTVSDLGGGVVDFTGGSLAAGASCSFDMTLDIPAAAPEGAATNTTSGVTGMVGGSGVTGDPASANLDISVIGTEFTASFAPDTVLPGASSVLTFRIVNPNAGTVSNLGFVANLDAMLSGLTATALPSDPCGIGSTLTGTDTLIFTGGEVPGSNGECSFSVTVQVPANAPGDAYLLTATNLSSAGQFSANLSGPRTLNVTPTADISVTKTDGATTATPGSNVTYTIVAANAGPTDAPSVTLADTFATDLTCTYTSVTSGGATGNTAGGAGDLNEALAMPVGSSATYTATCAIDSAATGTLSNTATVSSSILDLVGGNDNATDSDTVLAASADLWVTKTDGVTSVAAGQSVTYTIVAANDGPSDDPAASLSDTFPADLTCTYTSVASGGATGNTASGSGNLSETLSIPAGADVTYTATCLVDEAATGTLSNTASIAASASVTDPDATNNAATDADTVIAPAADISINKTDGVTSIVAGTSLTYTIDVANAGPSTDPAVSVADAFPADLTCTYTSAALGGATGNTASGVGDIADSVAMPSGSSVSYTATCLVDEAATGTLSNTATATSSVADLATGNNTATDADTVIAAEADLAITKDDGLTSVDAGLPLTYSIVVTNNGPSTDPAVSVADTFPAGLIGCSFTSVAAGGATGNSAGPVEGDLSESLSMPAGSSVTYSATCTVDPVATRTLSNTATITASVTDPAPGNDSATDGNTAISPTDLMFSKMFAPDSVEQGQTTELTFTINNDANSIAATGLNFTDDMTAFGLVLTSAAPVNGCGGSLTADPDTSVVSFSGGTVAAGTTCEITVTLRADTAGSHDNVSSTLFSNLPTQPPAEDTLAVSPAQVPTLSKTLSNTDVEEGEVITMTLDLVNPNGFLDAETVDLQDVMTGNLEVVNADASGSAGCVGTVAGAIGDQTVSFTGTVPATATCTITVDLIVLAAADFTNTATMTSSLGNASADVPVTVTAAVTPTLSKTLSKTAVEEGEPITMTLEIANPNGFRAAESVVLTDDMTGTLVVSTAATGTPGCDGTVAGAVGAETVSFTGTVAATETCTITVGLVVTASADFTNTASMTSSLGNASTDVPVTVTPAPPLTFTMDFLPDTVEVSQASTLRYTIENTSFVPATAISLLDNLPANLRIARPVTTSNTCTGGIVGAVEGGGTISYDGGALAALSTCTVSVDVQSGVADTYPNDTETQTSSLGDSAAASATLTVEAASTGSITIVQETDTDGDFVFSSAEPALNFTISTSRGRGARGPIDLPVGSYTITQNPPAGIGTTAISCDDGDSTGDPAARTITLNLSGLEAVTCTVSSVGTLQKTVDTINRFLTKRADLILSSEPRPGRRLDRLKRGYGNATQLSWSPGDLKAFLPFSADFAHGSNDYRFSTSMLQVRQAAASVALAHGSTKDAIYVDNYRFDAWFEAQVKKFDSGAQGDGHFAVAYFGADYLVTPDMLVGVILQIDDMEDLSAALNTSARGTGWMVGPYMTARLAPNLYFDGRVAAGRSTNEVSPFNTYVDEFKTDRWLAMASITGDFQQGPWSIRPAASLSYFEETQGSYVDGIGVTIPSQTVRLGQLKIGPTFSGNFVTSDGTLLAPYFGIDAIYNIGDTLGVTVTNPATPATEGWRGRLQAGLDVTTAAGTRISFGGTYDGLFRDGFESWGLMFDLTIPLSKPTAR